MVLRGAQAIRRPEPEERGPSVLGKLIPGLSMGEGREDQEESFPDSIREKPNKTKCVSFTLHPEEAVSDSTCREAQFL